MLQPARNQLSACLTALTPLLPQVALIMELADGNLSERIHCPPTPTHHHHHQQQQQQGGAGSGLGGGGGRPMDMVELLQVSQHTWTSLPYLLQLLVKHG